MKILLEELGELGQLELFCVQLAERLRCDVKRITIEQQDGDRGLELRLMMLPIDDQHQGISRCYSWGDGPYSTLHRMADEIAEVREQLQFAEVALDSGFEKLLKGEESLPMLPPQRGTRYA